MGLPVGEMQSAYISLYRGDTTLQALLTGSSSPTWNVFDADGVPTNQPFPYVVVQQILGKLGTLFVFGNDAADISTLVSVFTQAGGFATARGIAKRIDTLTHMTSLTLAGGFLDIGILRENYVEVPEKDGITQHIAQRFKAFVQG